MSWGLYGVPFFEETTKHGDPEVEWQTQRLMATFGPFRGGIIIVGINGTVGTPEKTSYRLLSSKSQKTRTGNMSAKKRPFRSQQAQCCSQQAEQSDMQRPCSSPQQAFSGPSHLWNAEVCVINQECYPQILLTYS